MNIWHIGAADSPNRVNGVNYFVWELAAQQTRQGHNVLLVIRPEDSILPDQDLPNEVNSQHDLIPVVNLESMPKAAGIFRKAVRRFGKPTVIHFHSASHPIDVVVAMLALRYRIPYVVTPNGALAPQLLMRGRIVKKRLYRHLVQIPYLRSASALIGVLPADSEDNLAYVKQFSGLVASVPNPVQLSTATEDQWKFVDRSDHVAYLGRIDIHHKGLDRLVQLAASQSIDVRIYGLGPDELNLIQQINCRLAPVSIHQPVYGEEKRRVLVAARAYVHLSRWEAFGISIAEAMLLGVPVIVSRDCHLAGEIELHGLGGVIDCSVDGWEQEMSDMLRDVGRLTAWSEAGREYAQVRFSSEEVFRSYMEIYASVLTGKVRSS